MKREGMDNPLKDLRIRAALAFAAFLIASAYFAIVHHVLFSIKKIGEVPAAAGIAIGSIYAVVAVVVLAYAWKLYRRTPR